MIMIKINNLFSRSTLIALDVPFLHRLELGLISYKDLESSFDLAFSWLCEAGLLFVS